MTGLFTPGRGIAAANLGGRGVLTPIQNILKSLRDFFLKIFIKNEFNFFVLSSRRGKS